MRLYYKISALICAILFVSVLAGCVVQPTTTSVPVTITQIPSIPIDAPHITGDSLIQYAKEELAKGEKRALLSFIAQAMINEDCTAKKDELREIWWNSVTDVSNVSEVMLTEDELRALSAVAYLVSFTGCFFDVQELQKNQLLSPIEIYYGMSMYLPLYSRPGWDALSFRGAYPPDSITEEDVYYLSAEKANDFVKQLLGIEIPELDVEGEFSDVICKDGKYAVAPQDIYMPDYLVSAYRYIGDGMFYVVYDEDDYATPGAEEEHHGISPNEKQMIVRRSSTSAWGFIVISKLKGGYVRIIPEGFAHPEGMTYIVNSSMIFDQQP